MTTTTSDDNGNNDDGMTQDSVGHGTIPPQEDDLSLTQDHQGETIGEIVANINFVAPPTPPAPAPAENANDNAPPVTVMPDVDADLPGYQLTAADALLDTIYGTTVTTSTTTTGRTWMAVLPTTTSGSTDGKGWHN
jgi:hypothetical protein